MEPAETPVGPIEIQPTETGKREKRKRSNSSTHLLMSCDACGRSWELPTLWALAADTYCHGLCELCQRTALIDNAVREKVAELRVVSKSMTPTDRN
jgi:predicted transcriptional regulator